MTKQQVSLLPATNRVAPIHKDNDGNPSSSSSNRHHNSNSNNNNNQNHENTPPKKKTKKKKKKKKKKKNHPTQPQEHNDRPPQPPPSPPVHPPSPPTPLHLHSPPPTGLCPNDHHPNDAKMRSGGTSSNNPPPADLPEVFHGIGGNSGENGDHDGGSSRGGGGGTAVGGSSSSSSSSWKGEEAGGLASADGDGDGSAMTTTTTTAAVNCRCRDVSGLYVEEKTVRCALREGCVACAYKVACFDVARDADFVKVVPNVRPEMCRRLKPAMAAVGGDDDDSDGVVGVAGDGDGMGGVYGYRRGMRVLTVGDGDFTFSLAVARIVLSRPDHQPPSNNNNNSNGGSGVLIATSYETRSVLTSVYPNIDDTIAQLEEYGARVCFGVDATNLSNTLPKDVVFGVNAPPPLSKNHQWGEDDDEKVPTTTTETTTMRFHRIVWNFPCTAIPNGQDGQNDAMEENRRLVARFVANAVRDLLLWRLEEMEGGDGGGGGGGEIHMMHKTKPPYDQWNLPEVALLDVAGGDDGNADDDADTDRARPLHDKNHCESAAMTTTVNIDGNPHNNEKDHHHQETHTKTITVTTHPLHLSPSSPPINHLFEYKGRIVLDRSLLPPYTPRKALNRKSFPCHDACVYVFGWKKSTAVATTPTAVAAAAKPAAAEGRRQKKERTMTHVSSMSLLGEGQRRLFPPTIPLHASMSIAEVSERSGMVGNGSGDNGGSSENVDRSRDSREVNEKKKKKKKKKREQGEEQQGRREESSNNALVNDDRGIIPVTQKLVRDIREVHFRCANEQRSQGGEKKRNHQEKKKRGKRGKGRRIGEDNGGLVKRPCRR